MRARDIEHRTDLSADRPLAKRSGWNVLRRNDSFAYLGQNALGNVTVSVGDGTWAASVWPSGSGKAEHRPGFTSMYQAADWVEEQAGPPKMDRWVFDAGGAPVADQLATFDDDPSIGWTRDFEQRNRLHYVDGGMVEWQWAAGDPPKYAAFVPGDAEHGPYGQTLIGVYDTWQEATAQVEAEALASGRRGALRLGPPNPEPLNPVAANPFYSRYDLGVSDEYDINCQKAAAAAEMRARGYDVTAAPRSGGADETGPDGLFGWFEHKPEDFHVVSMQGHGEGEKQLFRDVAAFGPNTRGAIAVDWRWGGGHAFSWRVDENGQAHFFDPQKGEEYPAGDPVFDQIEPWSAVELMRLDDKEFIGPPDVFEKKADVAHERSRREWVNATKAIDNGERQVMDWAYDDDTIQIVDFVQRERVKEARAFDEMLAGVPPEKVSNYIIGEQIREWGKRDRFQKVLDDPNPGTPELHPIMARWIADANARADALGERLDENYADPNSTAARVAGAPTYRGQHQPPDPTYGAPMNAPESMMPDLLAHPEWYGTGYDVVDAEAMVAIRTAVGGGPEADIEVYRAVPEGVTEINPGDWVTPSRTYAQIHAEANLGQEMDPDTGEMRPVPGTVLSQRVKAGDLYFEGNSIAEWGWTPTARRERLAPKEGGPRVLGGPSEPPVVGRTGYPSVDALVDEFLDQPPGDWTYAPPGMTMREYAANPENTHGACMEIAEQFAEFAKAKGFNAYTTDVYLDEIGYTPQGEPHGTVLDENGNEVPGFYPEHTVAEIYLPGRPSNIPLVIDFAATQYGYNEVPKVDPSVNAPTARVTGPPPMEATATRLAGKVTTDGGFTYDPRTSNYVEHGYAVAVPGNSMIIKDADFTNGAAVDAVIAYMDAHWEQLEANDRLQVGGWHDTEHGEVVLDLSEIYTDLSEATHAGIARDEQAIFNLDTFEEIPTGGTGGREAVPSG